MIFKWSNILGVYPEILPWELPDPQFSVFIYQIPQTPWDLLALLQDSVLLWAPFKMVRFLNLLISELEYYSRVWYMLPENPKKPPKNCTSFLVVGGARCSTHSLSWRRKYPGMPQTTGSPKTHECGRSLNLCRFIFHSLDCICLSTSGEPATFCLSHPMNMMLST